MRRTRGRRRTSVAAVTLALAAAVPLLGGCGIQPTDVVEAGGPASFQAFLDRDYDMLLFFRASDGEVVPVIRTTKPAPVFPTSYDLPGSGDRTSDEPTGPVPTEKVVAALLAGPRKEDRAAGLATSLPAATPGRTVVALPSPGRVKTHLPFPLADLDSTALRQLTCTIAYSQDADGRMVVELTGQDGTSRSGTCPLAPGRVVAD
ncbi:hypothetical protein PV396_18235 [Streptomyces sp. ME02-8801-2C]|uniref:hypothetical protein n=1 Tax=Streptomyces sp. ME02-8801-2C TaxID=3028680 RepID=UPI0029A12786|nr:hypothetical protein [Streptomyces sp. ME02-8801-2C]MDX3453861.1 hypothetical protein [Streptomyces sp. ME02-8801-2C]